MEQSPPDPDISSLLKVLKSGRSLLPSYAQPLLNLKVTELTSRQGTYNVTLGAFV
jgi:hypothetical protein